MQFIIHWIIEVCEMYAVNWNAFRMVTTKEKKPKEKADLSIGKVRYGYQKKKIIDSLSKPKKVLLFYQLDNIK